MLYALFCNINTNNADEMIFIVLFFCFFKACPDVEVLGATSVRDRCMQLGKLTDDLYNRITFSAMRAPQQLI